MNPKLLKILTLALHQSTGENEWQAAAIMFVRVLRKDAVEPEHVSVGTTSSSRSSGRSNGSSGGWTPHPSAQADNERRRREQAQRDMDDIAREFQRQAQARRQAADSWNSYGSRPNQAAGHSTVRMTFGKYGPGKGDERTVGECPTDYLQWLIDNANMATNFRKVVADELEWRKTHQ